MKKEGESFFWTSYSDLMTSLFFTMLVLLVICFVRVGVSNAQLISIIDSLRIVNDSIKVKNSQYERIIQLDDQFKVLSTSSSLAYDEENKIFYAKDFVGIEIFKTNQDVIKPEYLPTVKRVGQDLKNILSNLNNNKFSYQLVIEGSAARPWGRPYNIDSEEIYKLSYRRALALYREWKDLGLRNYNTEIIIAGSGFSGINRDDQIEENNKRFVIQIIPKLRRPDENLKVK